MYGYRNARRRYGNGRPHSRGVRGGYRRYGRRRYY